MQPTAESHGAGTNASSTAGASRPLQRYESIEIGRSNSSGSADNLVSSAEDRSMDASVSFFKSCLQRAVYHVQKNWRVLAFGQVLSFILAGGGASQSALNLSCGLSAPTFSVGAIYAMLSLNLFWVWLRHRRRPQSSGETSPVIGGSDRTVSLQSGEPIAEAPYTFLKIFRLHQPVWKYAIVALLDVEANYVTVLAYRYTTLTSVTLFDALAIPSSMILSKFVFSRNYTLTHLLGVASCLAGVTFNVMQDYESDIASRTGGADNYDDVIAQEYPHKMRGDIFAIIGGIMYGINDVACEMLVRKTGETTEYLGMIGFIAASISIFQSILIERDDILAFFGSTSIPEEKQSTCSSTEGWTLFAIFVGFNLLGYAGAARFLIISEAAFLNLSYLTGDAWSVFFSVVAEHIVPSPLFFVALVFVVSGVVIYEMAPSPVVREDCPTESLEGNPDDDDASNPVSTHSGYNSADGIS